MISYICNGGRLGENISYLYGIFKFAKNNQIPFSDIVLPKMYTNKSLLKDGSDKEYVFLNNMEMFSNINHVFKDDIDFSNFMVIDVKCKVDVATLKNFYKYYDISKTDNVIFKDWWSLDSYWVDRDPNYDPFLLNYICRPKELTSKLLQKYHTMYSNRTIGIHIRRKDFMSLKDRTILNDDAANNFKEYFNLKEIYTQEDIIKKIKSFYVTDPQSNILLFSDDPVWCMDNFSMYKNVYVLNNKPYEDMILLSLCDCVIRNPGSFFSVVANLLSKSNKQCSVKR